MPQIFIVPWLVIMMSKIHMVAIKWKYLLILGECIALWGEPNELSIQYRIYIFIQYV